MLDFNVVSDIVFVSEFMFDAVYMASTLSFLVSANIETVRVSNFLIDETIAVCC